AAAVRGPRGAAPAASWPRAPTPPPRRRVLGRRGRGASRCTAPACCPRPSAGSPCRLPRATPAAREAKRAGKFGSALPPGRIGRGPQDSVAYLRHQRAIRLRLRPHPLPFGVCPKGPPALLPLSQTGVAQHVHKAVAGAEGLGPVADILHAVLPKQGHGMGGEPGVKLGQL